MTTTLNPTVMAAGGPTDARGPRAEMVEPLAPRRFVLVGELPAAMAEPGRGQGYLPVIQLIKDWNNEPGCRSAMVDDGLPEGTDDATAAKIAVVVHALCDRDGHRLPRWVLDSQAPDETTLVPGVDLHSGFGRRMRDAAAPACQYHRHVSTTGFSSRWRTSTRRERGSA